MLPLPLTLLVFGLAVLTGIVGTWLARFVALRIGFVNHPNPIIPDHRTAVAYGGGFGILFGALVALALALPFTAEVLGGADGATRIGVTPPSILVGAILFATLGLTDDLHSYVSHYKFILQGIAALVTMIIGAFDPYAGLVHPLTGVLILDAMFSGLWILAVVNALNFVDVCDGLAATVAGLTLLLWGLVPGFSPYPAVALAFAGACFGFLVWNRPPAKIYMGDAGSNFLGFLLAAMILSEQSQTPAFPWLAMMCLWAGVPFFELLFISGVRMKKGLPWWKGSPDHFSLRLQRAGFTKAQVDLIAGAFVLFLWTCAAVMARLHWGAALVLSVILAIWTALIWRWLLRWEVRPEPEPPT
ncbi:MAG TPA: MraY family glycosyltransferase [bacterium]|nr:MraY family glycosyltransferase [bacterium]